VLKITGYEIQVFARGLLLMVNACAWLLGNLGKRKSMDHRL
jgi:hypothetical protein